MKRTRLHALLDPFAHIAPKAGLVIRVQAEVFIHVEQRQFRPIHAAKLDQCLEELDLRIARRQDNRRLATPPQDIS